MVKEVKGFNPIVCHVKDTTIGEEYVNSFPLGFSPVQDVFLFVNRFKMSPQDIIYRPFSKEHVNEIKTWITMYNKFDIKVPIFTILKDLEKPNYILPRHPRKWENIQNFQFLIVDGQHMITATTVSLLYVIL